MNYPEFLLVPILMLMDYYLTLYSIGLIKKGRIQEIFRYKSFELNPDLRESVEKQKIVDFKHLAATLFITAFCYLVTLIPEVLLPSFPESSIHFLLGMVIFIFIDVNANHIRNILHFHDINRNPDEIEGSIMQSQQMLLRHSTYQTASFIFVLGLIFLLTASYFVLGGILGSIVFMFKHRIWKKQEEAAEASETQS